MLAGNGVPSSRRGLLVVLTLLVGALALGRVIETPLEDAVGRLVAQWSRGRGRLLGLG